MKNEYKLQFAKNPYLKKITIKEELLEKYPSIRNILENDLTLHHYYYDWNLEEYLDKILPIFEMTEERGRSDFELIARAFRDCNANKNLDKILIVLDILGCYSSLTFFRIAEKIYNKEKYEKRI